MTWDTERGAARRLAARHPHLSVLATALLRPLLRDVLSVTDISLAAVPAAAPAQVPSKAVPIPTAESSAAHACPAQLESHPHRRHLGLLCCPSGASAAPSLVNCPWVHRPTHGGNTTAHCAVSVRASLGRAAAWPRPRCASVVTKEPAATFVLVQFFMANTQSCVVGELLLLREQRK